MAIGSAIQRGHYVYIYDEYGRQLQTLNPGGSPDDGLKGYTSSTVSVRSGNLIYTYDEKGRQKSVLIAR